MHSKDPAKSSQPLTTNPTITWRTVAEIVAIGFTRSRVVMANEAHNGLLRCIRTRLVGQDIIRAAHAAGCRTLAAEALIAGEAAVMNETRRVLDNSLKGYVRQPDMKAFLQTALDLGWTLAAYESESKEVDRSTDKWIDWEVGNRREKQQAENLAQLATEHSKMLVWCGNGHHCKRQVNDWQPMGFQFRELSGIEPFCIDQNKTTELHAASESWGPKLAERFRAELTAKGGVAGYLSSELAADSDLPHGVNYDANIFALENNVE